MITPWTWDGVNEILSEKRFDAIYWFSRILVQSSVSLYSRLLSENRAGRYLNAFN